MERERDIERSKNTDKEPFVSVVTPVYNQGEFLEECIQSVIGQTYSNWEYVIVNNCSTDHTLEIAEKYAATDARIRIHNNEEHLPVMENLNHAFRQISTESKYCKVIHGDDWIFPECIARMVELAEEYPSIGIVNSYHLEDTKVGPVGLPYPSLCIDGREICIDYLLGNSNYFGAPSNLLIRSSLIRKRDCVYDESYLQSDMAACLDILEESDFGFLHQVLTYTRRHKNGLTQSVAKKYFKYMLGELKIHLEYGPRFLSDGQFREVMKRREEVFYIQYAKNMLKDEIRVVYGRHAEELKSIGFPVKYGKLFKYLARESLRLAVQRMGVKLSRAEGMPG